MRIYATRIIAPEIMARLARPAVPWRIAYEAMIPDSAPVGPKILKLLPLKSEAITPAQIAVIMPTEGDVPDATASEIESGMETRETVRPDFQLLATLLKIFVI